MNEGQSSRGESERLKRIALVGLVLVIAATGVFVAVDRRSTLGVAVDTPGDLAVQPEPTVRPPVAKRRAASTVQATPTPEASSAPSPEASPEPSPTPTSSPAAQAPAPPPPPADPSPEPQPEPEPAEPDARLALSTDRTHYYAGEAVTVTVAACNEDPEHPARYFSSQSRDFGLHVWDRHMNFVWASSTGDDVYPSRSVEVAPGVCVEDRQVWDRSDAGNGGPAAAGTYKVEAYSTWSRSPGGNGPADVSVLIRLHDGPRPADGGQTGPVEPEPAHDWTLEVSTDAASYAVGEPVRITVRMCNLTDTEHVHTYSQREQRPISLSIDRIVYYDDGSVGTVPPGAWLYNGEHHNGTGTTQQFVLAPHTCETWNATWYGTSGRFHEDGASSGEPVDPATYTIEVRKTDGSVDGTRQWQASAEHEIELR